MNYETKAMAILDLARERIESAIETARAWSSIREDLGELTANWAFASNRLRSLAASEQLRAWLAGAIAESGAIDLRKLTPAILVLSGPPGTGKTAAASRVVAEHGGRCYRSGAIDRWSYRGDEMREALHLPFVLIDDAGIERSRSRGSDHLVEFLCARADAGRPTIVTTMLGLDGWAEHYPDQVTSRCKPGWRVIEGEDLRGRKVTPNTQQLDRLREIAKWGTRLEHVARRSVWGNRAKTVIESAMDLLGLDEAAVDEAQARLDAEHEKLVAEFDEVIVNNRRVLDATRSERDATYARACGYLSKSAEKIEWADSDSARQAAERIEVAPVPGFDKQAEDGMLDDYLDEITGGTDA